MTGAILTKFGRAPTTWTIVSGPPPAHGPRPRSAVEREPPGRTVSRRFEGSGDMDFLGFRRAYEASIAAYRGRRAILDQRPVATLDVGVGKHLRPPRRTRSAQRSRRVRRRGRPSTGSRRASVARRPARR